MVWEENVIYYVTIKTVDRTLHRRGDAKFNSRQITIFWEMPNFIAAKICWFTVSWSAETMVTEKVLQLHWEALP